MKKNPFEKIKYNKLWVRQILERIQEATPKVALKAKNFFVPKIEDTPPTLSQYFDYLRTDLVSLFKDPKNSVGQGEYDNWTSEEIAELYFVLFGETFTRS